MNPECRRAIAARRSGTFLTLALAFAAALTVTDPSRANDRATAAIEKLDRDGDGRVSRREWRKSDDVFDRMDGDGDGFLTVAEFRARFSAGGESGKRGRSRDDRAKGAPDGTTPPTTQAATAQPARAAGRLPAGMPELYFVDAHSQMADGLDETTIIPLMDRAGVWHTILSARNDRKPQDVAVFAAQHPARITGAVRSKGRAFNANRPLLKRLLSGQLGEPVFRAMAEAILFHAEKGNRAPEIRAAIDSPQATTVLKAAVERGWPFIAHYEFAAAGSDYEPLMGQFEDAARKYPNHPFMLIHMGQLGPQEAGQLIKAHPNVYFITSHSNPVNIARHPNQPWSNMFDDNDRLSPGWRALVLAHPERFVLAFDNVFPEFWGSMYLDQAALWRTALSALPATVAHAVAHGNAERLWKLPLPTR